jgi:hypothetical protein
MQVIDVGGPVGVEQADLGGLVVRVAGAPPPDVGLGVGGFGPQLGLRLARGLVRLEDLDAGLAGEFLGRQLAPRAVGAADGVHGRGLGLQEWPNPASTGRRMLLI